MLLIHINTILISQRRAAYIELIASKLTEPGGLLHVADVPDADVVTSCVNVGKPLSGHLQQLIHEF